MKEVYQLTKEELFHRYGDERGLKESKAAELLEEYGENGLEETGKKSIVCVFFQQFADLSVLILIVAAIISALSQNAESTIVIFGVLLLNAMLGTLQYRKAQASLDSLKELSAPRARVFREGVKQEVPANLIVPGDVLFLEAGDLVAADGRIIENHSLQVNESALTGEAVSVTKREEVITEKRPLGDRYNMAFAGSLVTYGRAKVLVTATGMDTQMGRIAALMNDTGEKKTPLQVTLDQFSRKLAMAIMGIGVFVFVVRILQHEPVTDSLMFAVALTVAAIPEALGSIVTIVQAFGTRRMAADNAIIKDLKAVESLGCISVICSDKTGTLTQNKMTVTQIYADGQCLGPEELRGSGEPYRSLLYNAVLNNDATICDAKEMGDPTEVCLLVMAKKAGLIQEEVSEEALRERMPRLWEIPFDSDRKLMTTMHRIGEETMVFTKGAVDVLTDRSSFIATKEGVRPITVWDRKRILEQNRIFSENGRRVLAFAYKEHDSGEAFAEEEERGYIFSGLVAMVDPPREESKRAVADARLAGIQPVMITGDHKVTATAIAGQIGIYREGDLAVTGQELDGMSQRELDQSLERITVYARVSPENKIRIVEAWQQKGRIVAMTGDGVNDAPALKKADIGVAMGRTGTEVSKDAAAMILTDDNFATIIKAVENGRNVYRNIINAVRFLLSGNLAAILVVLFCSVMALPSPFQPVHLLFINLVTDSLPALALGMEPVDRSLLRKEPRNPKEGLLTRKFMRQLLGAGVLIAFATQTAFYKGMFMGSDSINQAPINNAGTAQTMAFATLTLARLFHGFNCRGETSVLRKGLFGNMWSVLAFGIGVFLLALVLFVPFLQRLFMVTALNTSQIGWILVLAFLPAFGIQIIRMGREYLENR